MRSQLAALALASSFVACHSEILVSEAASTGAGTSTSVAASSGASSGGTGGGGSIAAAPSCTFSVNGAVDLAGISPTPVSAFVLGPNMFQCGSTADGGSDELVIYMGAEAALAVGPFTAPYAGSYFWQHCEAGTCTYYTNDASPYEAEGCVVQLEVAPVGDAPGQPVAGAFSCVSLVPGVESTKSVSLAGSFSLLTQAVGDSGGGGSGGMGGSGGSATVSTGGAGGGRGVSDFCAINVSGAIDMPGDTGDSGGVAIAAYLMCNSYVTGAEGWFGLDLNAIHGPGTYPLLGGGSFQLSFCAPTAQGCEDIQSFAPPSGGAGCSAVITEAPPVVPTIGQRIAGSISCPELVGDTFPQKSVSIDGSFSLMMQPPPD